MAVTTTLLKRKVHNSDLSVHDWQRLEPLLLAHVNRCSKWPLLEVVNAGLYVLKKGCLGRDLPGEFPPWGTAYWYSSQWQQSGTLDEINACLVVDYWENMQKKRSPPAL